MLKVQSAETLMVVESERERKLHFNQHKNFLNNFYIIFWGIIFGYFNKKINKKHRAKTISSMCFVDAIEKIIHRTFINCGL